MKTHTTVANHDLFTPEGIKASLIAEGFKVARVNVQNDILFVEIDSLEDVVRDRVEGRLKRWMVHYWYRDLCVMGVCRPQLGL